MKIREKKPKIRTIFQADSRIPLHHFTSERKIVLMKCTTSPPPPPLLLLLEESGQTDKSATLLAALQTLYFSSAGDGRLFCARPSKPRAKWRRAGRFAINKKRAELEKTAGMEKIAFGSVLESMIFKSSKEHQVSDALPSLQVFASTYQNNHTRTRCLSVSIK